jgi:hypothetical protein
MAAAEAVQRNLLWQEERVGAFRTPRIRCSRWLFPEIPAAAGRCADEARVRAEASRFAA